MTDPLVPRTSYATVLTAAALSCAAGATLTVLPSRPAAALTAAGALSILLGAIGVALRPAHLDRSQPEAHSRTDADEAVSAAGKAFAASRALARSRTVYLLGSATIGLLTIRPALSFTLSDWLFLLALGLTALAVLQTRKIVGLELPALVVGGTALFAVGGLVSSIHAVSPLGSAAIVIRMLYLIVPWFWVGTVLLRTQSHVQLAVSAWVLSAAVSSAGAVAQLFLGNVIPGGDVEFGRATGFTPQVNSLGALTAIALVPGLMNAVRARGWARLYAHTAAALIVAGLFLSGSIGGMLAAAVSTAVWLVASGRARQTLKMLAVLAVAALLLLGARGGAGSPDLLSRFSKVTQPDAPRAMGGTLYSRIDVYRAAWHEIGQQPFVGVGLDAASSTDRLGLQVQSTSSADRLDLEVHNIALQPWYTAGILGVLGIFILLGSVAYAGFGVVRSATTPGEHLLALALYTSFLAFVVDALSEPILYVRYGWAPAAFLLALRAQQRRKARRAREDRLAAAPLRGEIESPALAGGFLMSRDWFRRATPARW